LKVILSLVSVCLAATALQAQTSRPHSAREAAPARKVRPAATGSRYAKIELAEVAGQKDARGGRLVSVMAEVLSYDARLEKLELFDARSRAVVSVSLAQVGQAERRGLAKQPATDVTVYGRVALREGQPMIVAHKLDLVLLETERK
jgi:hypothetical protein